MMLETTSSVNGSRVSSTPRRHNSGMLRAHTTAYFAGLDANLQMGLAMVFGLYLIVTVGTFSKLPTPHHTGFMSSQNNLVRRAKVLLNGKYYQPAMTAADLKGLIAQEEAKLTPEQKRDNHYKQVENPQQAILQQQQQQQQHNVMAKIASTSPPVIVDWNEIAKVQTIFPIKATDSVEQIDHPGYQYANQQLFKGPPPPQKMTVPKYWNPPQYGGDVRKFLGDYGSRLLTPQEALAIGSKVASNDGPVETIYITIASYRDPECPVTIDSLFTRAKYPERLRVAVIDQRLDDDMRCIVPATPCSDDPHQVLCQYSNQIEALEMDARLGIGPVFARHLGYRHYRGEYFAMQVDAHVRFVQDWDASLVEQWHQAHNEMAVLSTYLSDLNNSIDPVTHAAIRPGRPIMCATDYEGQGKYKHLRHGQQPEGPAMIHGQPTLHPFWAAGFSFARGHFVVQVPYDQYLPMIFQGEEISIGLRGFTFGYDYYTPEKSVCFHMYAMLENKAKRDKVPHFWENTQTYRAAGTKAMQRLNGIIGMGDPADTYDHAEEKLYSLGHVRQKEKFFKTFGIHTDTQTVEHHLCQFVGQPMQRLFLRAMRQDQMGLDYDQINYEWKDPNPTKK